jgi:P27 family predicted phage terminase small subunit
MPMGRPPKPTALHVLNGNPSKKKDLGKHEPKPAPVVKIPSPPSWMNPDGKKAWKRLGPELERLGLLTVIDIETFAAACQSYGVWVECEQYLKKNGRTYGYTNKAGETNDIARPEVKIGQKALDQFKGLMSEFGLSPASRTRIEVKPPEGGQDPMEALLSGVR